MIYSILLSVIDIRSISISGIDVEVCFDKWYWDQGCFWWIYVSWLFPWIMIWYLWLLNLINEINDNDCCDWLLYFFCDSQPWYLWLINLIIVIQVLGTWDWWTFTVGVWLWNLMNCISLTFRLGWFLYRLLLWRFF